MKVNKFEGSFGEFIEEYLEGCTKFYVLNEDHCFEINFGDVKTLSDIYKKGDVYIGIEEEPVPFRFLEESIEVWTDHLPYCAGLGLRSFLMKLLQLSQNITVLITFIRIIMDIFINVLAQCLKIELSNGFGKVVVNES